jgi:inosose dehydratase
MFGAWTSFDIYQPHRGGPVKKQQEIDELLEKTDPQHVWLCLDTAHVLWGGGDPTQLMEKTKKGSATSTLRICDGDRVS